MTSPTLLGSDELTIKDFLNLAHGHHLETLTLDRNARKKMEKSRQLVESVCKSNTPVYGINTGFGFLKNTKIPSQNLNLLQKNIIRSHCTGLGSPLNQVETRMLMLLRAHSLALGYSGVRPRLVEILIEFLKNDILPIVPCEGSVGASGDLAPMAHLALALIGEGEVRYQGEELKTSVVLKQCKIEPLVLEPKEGLALINGTQLMLTYALLLLGRVHRISRVADIVAASSLEATRGTDRAFDALIQQVRPHPGQKAVADNIRRLLQKSQIKESHLNCDKVQDPYSFRCIPQVHGASRDYAAAVSTIVSRELHAVTDNPIVFADHELILSGGNFHGAPLAIGLDLLAIAVAEYGSISERRIEKMTNPHFSGHPAFLVKEPGLNSGLMMLQVSAAALASENKVLCHPASIDTIPTSADQEDHVSMGPIAARKLKKVILNTERILAMEALCARQGLWLLEPLKGGIGVNATYKRISSLIPPIENDRPLSDDINNIHHLLFKTSFVDEIKESVGELY